MAEDAAEVLEGGVVVGAEALRGGGVEPSIPSNLDDRQTILRRGWSSRGSRRTYGCRTARAKRLVSVPPAHQRVQSDPQDTESRYEPRASLDAIRRERCLIGVQICRFSERILNA